MDDLKKKPAPLRRIPRPQICSVCGQEKPLTRFRVRKDRPNGVMPYCLQCQPYGTGRTATGRRQARRQ